MIILLTISNECKMPNRPIDQQHHIFHPNQPLRCDNLKVRVNIFTQPWESVATGFTFDHFPESFSEPDARRRVAPQIQIQIQAQIHSTTQRTNTPTLPRKPPWPSTPLALPLKRKTTSVQNKQMLFSVKYQRQVSFTECDPLMKKTNQLLIAV